MHWVTLQLSTCTRQCAEQDLHALGHVHWEFQLAVTDLCAM